MPTKELWVGAGRRLNQLSAEQNCMAFRLLLPTKYMQHKYLFWRLIYKPHSHKRIQWKALQAWLFKCFPTEPDSLGPSAPLPLS